MIHVLSIQDGGLSGHLGEIVDGVHLSWLSQADLDHTQLQAYMAYDVIMVPWRPILLELALAREKIQHGPVLVLASGGVFASRAELLTTLIEGGICEVAIQPLLSADLMRRIAKLKSMNQIPAKLARWRAQDLFYLRPQEYGRGRVVTREAFARFTKYHTGSRHGPNTSWDASRVDEEYDTALRTHEEHMRKTWRERNEMLVRPAFPVPPEDMARTQHTCFVIMPFDQPLSEFYNDIIKPSVAALGISVRRADDVFSVGSVINDIWLHLTEADFVIADLTGRNPNVFYELGLAHVLGKPTVLMTQNMADLPFDVRHHRAIQYGMGYKDIEKLREALQSACRGIIRNLERHLHTPPAENGGT